jgi:uncharacterized small protein (TIGR04563 family)
VTTSETRRQNLYFPGDMLTELQNEAKRQDRSISWLIQQAWRIARKELRRIPSTSDYMPDFKADDDSSAGGET